MRVQRVRIAESRIEMQIVKWTAEGMVKRCLLYRKIRVFHDVTHTSVARGMLVSRREHRIRSVNQGGTANYMIRPW